MQMVKLLRDSFAGSGSSYLYGFFDQAWKEGMSKDEAEVFRIVVCALEHIEHCSTRWIRLKYLQEEYSTLRMIYSPS